MKINKLIKKDLKLLKRDHKTLILIILAPILILFILGNIFGQTTNANSINSIKLGLCNLDQEYKEIKIPLFEITNLENKCEEKAQELVLKGKLRASLIIPEEFSKNIRDGYGSEIILYVDNSKTQTAIIASESIKALIQNLNENIGTDFINKAWDNLNKLNKKLKIAVKEASIAKDQAELQQKNIISLQENLSYIKIEDINNQIKLLNETFSNINLTNISLSKDLSEELESLKLFYNSSCSTPINKECIKINQSIINLEKNLNNSKDQENKINNAINSINTNNISNKINLVNKSKEEIINKLEELNNTFFEYTNSLINTIDELNATTQLLDVYTSRDPKNIVRAVALNENKVFGEKTYFEFLAPGLILLLLLFTTILISSSNIVYERKIGTLARALLSPTPIIIILISKILFFIIISAIELTVMLIVLKFFGITIPLYGSVLLTLLISSINFILIGLILGSISDSENTALLSSLVVILPMFFLSNLLFPFEIMPEFMKEIGSNLPLTLSINSLESIIIYNTSLNIEVILKLLIISLILLILLYLIIKNRPTAE